jgi:hypothetical protein
MTVSPLLGDAMALVFLEAVLLLALAVSAWKDFWAWVKHQRGKRPKKRQAADKIRLHGASADLSVLRGDRTMRVLLGGFAGAAALYGAVVQVADFVVGYKAMIHTANTVALLYLFLKNRWFRNTVAIPLMERLRKG